MRYGSIIFLLGLVQALAAHPTSQQGFPLEEAQCSLFGDYEITLWAHRATSFASLEIRWPSRIVLTTHMTIDRLPLAISQCERFRGPMSISVFIGSTAARAKRTLEMIRDNFCLRTYADIHLVRRSSLALDETDVSVDDQANGVRLPSMTFQYPFNTQRNAASAGARGQYIFQIDVDLEILPVSFGNHDALLRHIQFLHSFSSAPDRVFWVVPALQTENRLAVTPQTIWHLKDWHWMNKLNYFYPECPYCYRTVDIYRFIANSVTFERELLSENSEARRLCLGYVRSGLEANYSNRIESPLVFFDRCSSFLSKKGLVNEFRTLKGVLHNISDPTFELANPGGFTIDIPGIEPFIIIRKEHLFPMRETFIGRNCDKNSLFPELEMYGMIPIVAPPLFVINRGPGDAPNMEEMGWEKLDKYFYKETQNYVAYDNWIEQLKKRKLWNDFTDLHSSAERTSLGYHSHIRSKDDIMVPPRPHSRFLQVVLSRRWNDFLTYKPDEPIVCITAPAEESEVEDVEERLSLIKEKACSVIDCSEIDDQLPSAGNSSRGLRGLPALESVYKSDWILHRYWRHHYRQSSDNHASYCINGGLGELVVAYEGFNACLPREDVGSEKLESELDWLCDEFTLGDCRELFEDRLGGGIIGDGINDVLGVGEGPTALWSERSLRFKFSLAMTFYFNLMSAHFLSHRGLQDKDFCNHSGTATSSKRPEELIRLND